MGSATRDDNWNERPAHQVTISQSFLMSETEVTLEQFRQFRPGFVGTPGCEPYVAGVSWSDAMAFCEWLTKKEGKPYRLPTEAEWEYAASAGKATPTQLSEPITDWWICRLEDATGTFTNPLLTFCHYVCSEGSSPVKVRSLAPNPWGLYDTAGNVGEWVWDVFGLYSAGAATDPVGPASGAKRVTRSATIVNYGPDCRSARRDGLEPDWASTGLGLRVVRTLY
jgi:formylglycine-generating enzyme required for sulfatase activity